MTPENTHKLMGFYVEVLILDVWKRFLHLSCIILMKETKAAMSPS